MNDVLISPEFIELDEERDRILQHMNEWKDLRTIRVSARILRDLSDEEYYAYAQQLIGSQFFKTPNPTKKSVSSLETTAIAKTLIVSKNKDF